MAGTVTITKDEANRTALAEVIFDWISSSGAADGTTPFKLNLQPLLVYIKPGTDTPTDLYDVVLTDDNGYDILAGSGADCSATYIKTVSGALGNIVNSTLTLAVTNAGNAKTGQVVVQGREEM